MNMSSKKFTKPTTHDGPEEPPVLTPKPVNGMQMRPKNKQANYNPETVEEAQKFYKFSPRKDAAPDKGAGRQVG